jgi:hypothetical protein
VATMTKEEERALLQRWREQGAGAEQILSMSRRLSSDELRALDGLPPRAVSVARAD